MNIADKKTEIIQILQSVKDEQLIEEVYELVHADRSVESVDISSLPKEIQDKINNALSDYKSGNYITHRQMKEKVKQWLMS